VVRFSVLFFRDYDTVGYLLSVCSMWGQEDGNLPIPGHSPIVNRNRIESFVDVPHTPSFRLSSSADQLQMSPDCQLDDDPRMSELTL
jgi:hypothetical protein